MLIVADPSAVESDEEGVQLPTKRRKLADRERCKDRHSKAKATGFLASKFGTCGRGRTSRALIERKCV